MSYSSEQQHTVAVLASRMHEFISYLPLINHELPDPPEDLDELDAWVWMMRYLSTDLKVPTKVRMKFSEILGEIDDFHRK